MIKTHGGWRTTQVALLVAGLLAWLGWPVCRPTVVAQAESSRDGGWSVAPPTITHAGSMDAGGRLFLLFTQPAKDGKSALAVRCFDAGGHRTEPRPLRHDGYPVRAACAEGLTVSPSGHRWWLLTSESVTWSLGHGPDRPFCRLWAVSDDGAVTQAWTTTFFTNECLELQAVGEDTVLLSTIAGAVWRYRSGASEPERVDIGERVPALIDAAGRFYIEPDDYARRAPCRTIEPDGRLGQYVWPSLSGGRGLYLFAHSGRYLYATGKPRPAHGLRADGGRAVYRVGRLGLPQWLLSTDRLGLPAVCPPLAVDGQGSIWFVGYHDARAEREWVLLRAQCAPRWRCWLPRG